MSNNTIRKKKVYADTYSRVLNPERNRENVTNLGRVPAEEPNTHGKRPTKKIGDG